MIWISNRYDIDHAYLSTSVSSFDKDLIFSWNNTPVRLPHFYNNNTTFKSFFWVREKCLSLRFLLKSTTRSFVLLSLSCIRYRTYVCIYPCAAFPLKKFVLKVLDPWGCISLSWHYFEIIKRVVPCVMFYFCD